jgi:hypothetical protein
VSACGYLLRALALPARESTTACIRVFPSTGVVHKTMSSLCCVVELAGACCADLIILVDLLASICDLPRTSRAARPCNASYVSEVWCS